MKKIISFAICASAFLTGYVFSIPVALYATGMPIQLQAIENNKVVEIKTWRLFKRIDYPLAGDYFPAIVIPYKK